MKIKNVYDFFCRTELQILLGTGVAIGCWLILAALQWPQMLALTRYEVTLRGLPRELDGTRIAVISDLHLKPALLREGYYRRAAELVNRTDPDLVVHLGDFGNRRRRDPNVSYGELVRVLQSFHARHGSYAVLGNHDIENLHEPLRQALTASRVQLLDNQHVSIPIKENALELAGVSEMPDGPADAALALRRVRHPQSAVLLAHQPKTFYQPNNTAGLTLAGHSHGGQIRLPLIGANYWRLLGKNLMRGTMRDAKGRQMIVSGGLGTSVLPLRWNNPPEVLLVTLRASK